MNTLVECYTYKQSEKDLLCPSDFNPVFVNDFRVNASPKEVLEHIFPKYNVVKYLGCSIYPIEHIEFGKHHLSVSALEDSKRSHGSIDDFMNCQDFDVATRDTKLNKRLKEKKGRQILRFMDSGDYTFNNSKISGKVLSDVLYVCGFGYPAKDIDQILSDQSLKKSEEAHQSSMESFARRAKDWNEIANKTVGF